MIPLRLQLQNFMAYKATQSLSFSDIHVACLTGENGAGKSTLLDAITWALWGKARTRMDDDLIHLGEKEMEVEFSFALGDEHYRVLRRRSSAKRGKSELHFHIADAGGWRTLTEGSIRLTQAKVNRLLRLDYDTFINSAFLLQGRADEFTTKKAAERKQILSDILGLGIYDEYEEKSAVKARHYHQEARIIEAQLEQMEMEMALESDYRREWETSRNKAAVLNKDLRETETRLDDLRQQHKELDIKQRQLKDLRQRLQQAQRDLDEVEKTVADIKAKIKRHQSIIANQSDIEAGYQKLQRSQNELEDWNERLSQFSALSAEEHNLEKIIQRVIAKLEADIKIKRARLKELSSKASAVSRLETQLQTQQDKLAALQAQERERDAQRDKLNALNTEEARLKEEKKQLKAEMDKIKARLTQLEEAGSTCPVCAQPLNESHRQQVKQEFTADGTLRGNAYRANTARLKQIAAEQRELNAALKRSNSALRQLPGAQASLAKTEQQLLEARQAQESLNLLEQELESLQAELSAGDFEAEAKAQLAQVQQKLAQLAYNAPAHKAAKESVANLTRFAAEIRELQEAQTRLQEAQTRLQEEEERLRRLRQQTSDDQARVDRLSVESKALPEIARQLSETNAQVDALQREERLARDAVAAARQKLDHLAYLAKERGNKEAQLAELKEIEGIYRELRVAFGKKGVQALLIEHSIPELEDETNAILSRMTDGRVNLQFITQRSAKTSDNTIETLDIRIADELGTRNYDLYSGGEAFRVNFAIRIALSKLLARRAGASLQTLVVDEGFGTQDTQGRERLVDAIRAVQDDFEKVLVITHIEELRDAFPVHINIQKTKNGSEITVV